MTSWLHPRRAALPACLLLASLLTGAGPRAAETLRYAVAIAPTGEAAIDAAMTQSATLVSLRDTGEISPLALVARARADEDRLAAALRSLGRYRGTSRVTIAGTALDDPDLPDRLTALPDGAEVAVAVSIDPGPPTRLGRIVVDGDTAGLAIGLAPGDPAVAADVLGAGARLQAALLAAGHAFARVDPPIADLAADAATLDVTFQVAAGPRVAIGTISVAGLSRLDEGYVRRRLTLKLGEMFSPGALEAARADLARVPAISTARLIPAAAPDASGQVPVTVQIAERPLRVVTFSAGFSTDQGGTAQATWTHRNLFGQAEVLSLQAGVTDLGASAATGPGYRLGAALTLPDWRVRDQSWTFTALAVRENLDAYQRTAVVGGAAFGLRLLEHLTASAGVSIERSYIVQNGNGQNYALLQTPLALRYDSTDSQTEPTRGFRADVLATPTLSLSQHNATFVIGQIAGSSYFDLAEPGRSVLALRGLIGSVSGASTLDIPPDQRFYAGGSGTVRGYRYQSLGPQFSNARPTGGTALAAGSVEFRQRFGETWGAALFADAGQLGTGSRPLMGKFQVGVGGGIRYYTGIGAIRVDAAMPVARPKGGDVGEIYIGLGQAF